MLVEAVELRASTGNGLAFCASALVPFAAASTSTARGCCDARYSRASTMPMKKSKIRKSCSAKAKK